MVGVIWNPLVESIPSTLDIIWDGYFRISNAFELNKGNGEHVLTREGKLTSTKIGFELIKCFFFWTD